MLHLVRLAARLVNRPAPATHRQLKLPFERPALSLVAEHGAGRHAAQDIARRRAVRSQRPFWISQDPHDCRRTAIGGSFAEVCAALESLAAMESCASHT